MCLRTPAPMSFVFVFWSLVCLCDVWSIVLPMWNRAGDLEAAAQGERESGGRAGEKEARSSQEQEKGKKTRDNNGLCSHDLIRFGDRSFVSFC